jgi:hypothetical protein
VADALAAALVDVALVDVALVDVALVAAALAVAAAEVVVVAPFGYIVCLLIQLFTYPP